LDAFISEFCPVIIEHPIDAEQCGRRGAFTPEMPNLS
jgi:hypothetical protein